MKKNAQIGQNFKIDSQVEKWSLKNFASNFGPIWSKNGHTWTNNQRAHYFQKCFNPNQKIPLWIQNRHGHIIWLRLFCTVSKRDTGRPDSH